MLFIIFNLSTILFICGLCFSRGRVFLTVDRTFGLLGLVVTQAILMLLFSSGGFVFLSSSCGIFFAPLIPSSSSFLINFAFQNGF